MDLRKIIKWSRRLATSCLGDSQWKHPGIKPSWVGSRSGGAYVDLSLLDKPGVVYSFGIATEISFDRAIIAATGCQVFGFDPDPRCTSWLKEPGRWIPPGFHFSELALGASSGTFSFQMADMDQMSGSLARDYVGSGAMQVRCLSLKDIMASHGHERVDYLKLDIEGAEYDVLEAWLSEYETLPVKQLWLEFHYGKNRTEKASQELARRLSKIGMVPGYRNYFRCPNNCLLINERMSPSA